MGDYQEYLRYIVTLTAVLDPFLAIPIFISVTAARDEGGRLRLIQVVTLTVFLVRKGTLDEFVYLEHGAHYAIGILALIMFLSVEYEIPEWFTGLSGVAFIGVSLWSSIRYRRNHALPA